MCVCVCVCVCVVGACVRASSTSGCCTVLWSELTRHIFIILPDIYEAETWRRVCACNWVLYIDILLIQRNLSTEDISVFY
jgi:hypothetical protein